MAKEERSTSHLVGVLVLFGAGVLVGVGVVWELNSVWFVFCLVFVFWADCLVGLFCLPGLLVGCCFCQGFWQGLLLAGLFVGWLVLVFVGEFDPGSGRTLAACLTHASRTKSDGSLLLSILVANG